MPHNQFMEWPKQRLNATFYFDWDAVSIAIGAWEIRMFWGILNEKSDFFIKKNVF